MPFQFWAFLVQCSQSEGGIVFPGFKENQRRRSVSQAIENACSRPPGKRTRYCCSGFQPNV